jgi:hypothetical protein
MMKIVAAPANVARAFAGVSTAMKIVGTSERKY